MRHTIRFAPLFAALAAGACATTTGSDGACDRTCLEAAIDGYLAALIDGAEERLPVTDDVLFAENMQMIPLGQGVWNTMNGRGTYSHYFSDPDSGNAGFIGTMRENGVPVIYDLRLLIEDGRIAEIESYIIRDAYGALRYEQTIGTGPAPEWLESVPEGERLSREELIAATDRYFSTMELNDGGGDYSFFHDDCNRLEHATRTTNMDPPQPYGHIQDTSFTGMTCADQWATGFLGFVTEIRDRRQLIVDEERQAVLHFVTFDHDGTVRELHLAGSQAGSTAVMPPYFGVPRTLQVNEGFLVRDGKVFRIEMTLFEPPYGIRQPWPASADGAEE